MSSRSHCWPGCLRTVWTLAGVAVDADHASGVAVILLDAEKENRIVVVSGANMECGREEEEAAARALDGAQVLLVQHEIPMQVNLDAARHACEAGTNSCLEPGAVRGDPGGRVLQ